MNKEAIKPIAVTSAFESLSNRMVVTMVFPTRDGSHFINDERRVVEKIAVDAIRSEYLGGKSKGAEIQTLKAEVARLQEIILKQTMQSQQDANTITHLTAKVDEQAEFILKQRGRINDLKSRTFAYAYGMSNNINRLNPVDVLFATVPNESKVSDSWMKIIKGRSKPAEPETQAAATEEFWAKFHTLWNDLSSSQNCQNIMKLEDPIPVISLNIFEMAALQIYCREHGSNVLLQRQGGKLIISSPTCRNPVEVEVFNG